MTTFLNFNVFAAARGDVVEPEQAVNGEWKHRAAASADIRCDTADGSVQVTACRASLGGCCHDKFAALVLLGRREDHLGDLVPIAFVIDDAARTELGDGEEARSVHKIAIDPADCASPTRDER